MQWPPSGGGGEEEEEEEAIIPSFVEEAAAAATGLAGYCLRDKNHNPPHEVTGNSQPGQPPFQAASTHFEIHLLLMLCWGGGACCSCSGAW